MDGVVALVGYCAEEGRPISSWHGATPHHICLGSLTNHVLLVGCRGRLLPPTYLPGTWRNSIYDMTRGRKCGAYGCDKQHATLTPFHN